MRYNDDNRYLLDDQGDPVLAPNPQDWSKALEKGCVLAVTRFKGNQSVRTFFLGANYGTEKSPLFFETVYIHRGVDLDSLGRYPTWEAALAGHHRAVEEKTREGAEVSRHTERERPSLQRRSQWERLAWDD